MKISGVTLAPLALVFGLFAGACTQSGNSKQPSTPFEFNKVGNEVHALLPNNKNVVFNCNDLAPNGALTGSFVAAADVTTQEQMEQMKKAGTYEIFMKSKQDSSTQAGLYMIGHISGHTPPNQFCRSQAEQIRTGKFNQIPGDTCAPVKAAQLCLGK